MCPGFSDQYINPKNLASQWPFFSQVTDVSSFDDQLSLYLGSSGNQGFIADKYIEQLGCSNSTSTFVLQYSQTFLWWVPLLSIVALFPIDTEKRLRFCNSSMFTQISYTAGCYTGTNVIRRMACQQTCLQFASSENYLVSVNLSLILLFAHMAQNIALV